MINYRLLFFVSLLIIGCAALGKMRLDIDTDLARSLPASERVIADALEIFNHHPIHDQVAVDIMLNRDDKDVLVEAGAFLEQKMTESGLFAQVGTNAMGELIPRLALHVAKNLPLLFSSDDLQKIAPLLDRERINGRLHKLHEDLGSLEGVGQAEFIGLDPLGLKDLILAKMALLAPSMNAQFYKGHLLSGDGRHLLVTARPLSAGSNTASARAISDFFALTSQEMAKRYAAEGMQVTLTPVGAYRAALDNERMIRHDVQFAIVLSTAGIALLLFLSFSRPLIGLLSLLPSFAGTAAALFVYSLFRSSISIMVLGFGGALISITVDYGIAYLLFLDRPHESSGKEAAHEVRVVGIMAMVTTVAAFLVLCGSGFPVFMELGLFSSLGVLFSFLFVHTIFPRIFPVMPAGKDRVRPLQKIVTFFYSTGKPGAIAAVLLACGLIFFARPQVHVSMSSMNTVSQSTEAADAMFTDVWGKIGDRIFVMNKGDTVSAIQQSNDLSLARMEKDVRQDILAAAFVPSMIFPGQERASQNVAAWHAFWDTNRVAQVQETLGSAGAGLGFTPDAFAPFFSLLAPGFAAHPQEIPKEYYGLLGISENARKPGLIQFLTVTPGKKYDGADFLARYGGDSKIFDSAFFTKRLADLLFSTFTSMLVIIAISVTLLIYLVSLSLPLTALTMLPSAFAYICTLGTMNLLGRPLDIPALMLLSIAILGMGIDYAIFCVRGHQRYRDVAHPSFVRVRSSIFLSATSTMIGFGVLCFAEHRLLQSIGIASLLGIGYSLLGSFLLLPPLLEGYFFGTSTEERCTATNLAQCIRRRFRTVEAYPRMFARFKLRLDPLFDDLPRMLAAKKEIATIVDIGCGYGIPACWCLETFKGARIMAIEPDPERVRVAGIAMGERGTVTQGWAPEMPAVSGNPADIVLLLDMLHYVDDGIIAAIFRKSFQMLAEGGLVVARCTLRPSGRPSWSWRLETTHIKLSGHEAWFRSPEKMAGLLAEAGFTVIVQEITANPELAWIVGQAKKEAAGAAPIQ
ncbi:MAG: methyltransferase domain-containing protein [Desulfurivibrionaceae bacterium]|jgi:predicted exporter/SAM-dependent methyltransferase